MKKYPDTYTNGYISLEVLNIYYLELLRYFINY